MAAFREEPRRELQAELESARDRIAELEAEAGRYRTLVEAAGESIIVVQDGQLVFHNPAFAQMVALGPADFESRPFVEFVHPDDRQGLLEMYLQMLSDPSAARSHEFRTVPPDGEARWYSIRGTTISWQGRPAVLCSLTEISERKRAQLALEQSEEDYRQLFQSVPAAIYEIDLSRGRFLRVNDQMCEYLGYSREEVLAMHPRELLGDASRELESERIARRMKGEAVPELVEFQIRTKDGRDLWVLLNLRVRKDEDGSLRASVVAQDITARRRLDAELQNVQKLESLGVLAGGIAHDFHNLLTTIVGSVSLAERAQHDPNRVAKHCAEARRACAQAKRLTQQLLTFSEGGAPTKRTTPLRPLLEDCTHFALGRADVQCSLELPEDVWALDADEGQIAQVVSNLVINARQAMPRGGRLQIEARNVELEAEAELPLQSGRYVVLSVRDDGSGIAAEQLPKIFDPFFSTKREGTGLGLTAAHSIVKRHGGHLSVESAPGRGTTFTIHLPAARKDSDRPSQRGTTTPRAPRRVLLMEDQRAVRMVAAEMLSELGCEVVTASDGAEALARFLEAREAGAPFDVTMMDLTVRGGMGGAELIQRIRELDSTVLAVVASGYSSDPVLASPAEHGFDAALHKPYSLDGLEAVLATLTSRGSREPVAS